MARWTRVAGRSAAVAFVLAGAGWLAAASARDEARASVPNFTLQALATNLTSITGISHAGDGRLFLVLQTGRIVIYQAGQVLPTPFLDVSSEVSCCGERGLLSMAFHPLYPSNGFFYVNYTNRIGDTVIQRFRVSPINPNRVDPGSNRTLLTIAQPFANHNGGQLQFGPDGYLYVGMGDGGSSNDPACLAQRDDTLLGKMLRIDVNQNVENSPYYGIPPDNPYVGAGNPPDEVWSRGLRNPWRFSFDRLTGDLWIADVGQGQREEVNFQPRSSRGGENYGWKFLEGTRCTDNYSGCFATAPCESPDFTAPIYEYRHGMGECSIVGGYVYRGREIPDLVGFYVYGDYCSGRIWAGGQPVTPVVRLLTTFGEDVTGELYLGTEDGRLLRAVNANPPSPTPTRIRAINAAPRPARTPEPVRRPA